MKTKKAELSDAQRTFLSNFQQLQESLADLPIPEQRQKIKDLFLLPESELEPIYRTERVEADGKHGKIPIKIVSPERSAEFPLLLYFHRGGWIFGSIEEAEGLCRRLANGTGCAVAIVGYRLAPEHPFPIPLDDCTDALTWAKAYCPGQKVVLVGESAGGNLAAAVALRVKGDIAAQVLINPVMTRTMVRQRYEDSPDKILISYENMEWFWQSYASGVEDSELLSPLVAKDLSALPKTLLITSEYDALRDEGKEYAERLQQAGVETTYRDYEGMLHGFMDSPIPSEAAAQAIEEIKFFISSLD